MGKLERCHIRHFLVLTDLDEPAGCMLLSVNGGRLTVMKFDGVVRGESMRMDGGGRRKLGGKGRVFVMRFFGKGEVT
jgi:hypothetical protein